MQRKLRRYLQIFRRYGNLLLCEYAFAPWFVLKGSKICVSNVARAIKKLLRGRWWLGK